MARLVPDIGQADPMAAGLLVECRGQTPEAMEVRPPPISSGNSRTGCAASTWAPLHCCMRSASAAGVAVVACKSWWGGACLLCVLMPQPAGLMTACHRSASWR